MTRYVRKAIGRGIIKKYLTEDENLLVVTLDRAVEDLLVSGLQHRDDGSTSLQIDPELAQKILDNMAQSLDAFQQTGTQPIILCGSLIRWEIKKLLMRFLPGVVVLAFDEIPTGVKTQSINIITI